MEILFGSGKYLRKTCHAVANRRDKFKLPSYHPQNASKQLFL